MGSSAGPASQLSAAGVGMYSSIMSGEGQKAADLMQSEQLERKAQIGRIAATEANSDMISRLDQSLGNIDAVRAARNTDPASPTGAALRDRTEAIGNQERNIKVGNILAQASVDDASAAYLKSAGKFAQLQGVLSGIATLGKPLGQTDFSKFGFGSGDVPDADPAFG